MEKFEVRRLSHNGVLIPVYNPVGFKIRFRGRELPLTPEQ